MNILVIGKEYKSFKHLWKISLTGKYCAMFRMIYDGYKLDSKNVFVQNLRKVFIERSCSKLGHGSVYFTVIIDR